MTDGPCTIKPDNQAVCLMLQIPNGMKLRKCIEIRHQLLTYLIKHNHFWILNVRGDMKKVDMFTKPLQRVPFWKTVSDTEHRPDIAMQVDCDSLNTLNTRNRCPIL